MSDETHQLIVESLTNEQLADFIDPEMANGFAVNTSPVDDIYQGDEEENRKFYILSEIAKRLRNQAHDVLT